MKHLLAIACTIIIHQATFSFTVHAAAAPAIATGQAACYDTVGTVIPCAGTGQDGDTKPGVPWPTPRFTDYNNGTVTDNLTGLIWLKDANCFGAKIWVSALTSANSLANGVCGLSDGSTAGQWRLPSLLELRTMPNLSQANPAAWLNAQGFANVKDVGLYWSSTTYANSKGNAWVVDMSNSYTVFHYDKLSYYYIWPVRGGL